jgi:hypothetical protein
LIAFSIINSFLQKNPYLQVAKSPRMIDKLLALFKRDWEEINSEESEEIIFFVENKPVCRDLNSGEF